MMRKATLILIVLAFAKSVDAKSISEYMVDNV